MPEKEPVRGPHTTRLAGYILTRNEGRNIAGSVRSLKQVTDSIIVLDSGSTDDTTSEAERSGAVVEVRSFDSFAIQRNFALDLLVGKYDPEWIFALDADERLSAGLVAELRTRIVMPQTTARADGFMVPLSIRFGGRMLRHGGLARSRLLRLYRADAGRYESRSVNEHFALFPGKVLGLLDNPIEHEDVTSWEEHIEKHNRYSTLEARERFARTKDGLAAVSIGEALRLPYLRRRWLREKVWNGLPAKPVLRFLQMYGFGFGFLDGRAGIEIALWHAWQEMCTEKKFQELVRANDVRRSHGE